MFAGDEVDSDALALRLVDLHRAHLIAAKAKRDNNTELARLAGSQVAAIRQTLPQMQGLVMSREGPSGYESAALKAQELIKSGVGAAKSAVTFTTGQIGATAKGLLGPLALPLAAIGVAIALIYLPKRK